MSPRSTDGKLRTLTFVAEERRGVSRRQRLAAGAAPVSPAAVPDERAARAPAHAPRVAILVAHGMGQQVKFETLDAVATALRGEALRRGQEEPGVAVRLLRFDEAAIPRAELTLRDAHGRERDVHLLEAYWAPLT